MARFPTLWTAFWRDRTGATALEYCIVAFFLSIAIIAGVRSTGTNLSGLYLNKVANNMS